VESAKGDLHVALPKKELTVAEVHVTVTAETGTVAQPENVVEGDCTVRVQLPKNPFVPRQVTDAGAFPGTDGESGSVAENEMVAGVAVMPLMARGVTGGRVSLSVVRGLSVEITFFCPAPAANRIPLARARIPECPPPAASLASSRIGEIPRPT